MEPSELIERIEDLERRLSLVEGRTETEPKTIDQVQAELFSAVARCTPAAAERWLKDTELYDRARAFYGAPRAVLEKLQNCLSRNSWHDLLEIWRDGHGCDSQRWAQKKLLEDFERLELMGEVIVSEDSSRVDLGIEVKVGPYSRAKLEQIRSQNRKEVAEAKARADAWLEREFGQTSVRP
jgi:hypothetical protein